VTAHYAGLIERLPAPPVIIGHSFGGMIAEKLLGQDLGAAAVAIEAGQIKGVLPLSALRAFESATLPRPPGKTVLIGPLAARRRYPARHIRPNSSLTVTVDHHRNGPHPGRVP
jgi:pimeloyl-ACP methyl ester carboxylesterase